jgi:carbonic anhydrase
MNRHLPLRVAALALVLSSVTPFVARGGEAIGDASAVRERISADIAAGLAHSPATPAPRPLTSRPAPLHVKPATHAAPIVEAASTPPDTTPDGIWNDLMAGNRRFVAEHPNARPYIRERGQLVASQHPRTIVLGCADSRVSPELVFDQTLGDLFVVRTAGNIVDPIALGSLEYAVEHLHAHLLVVLGHTSCGAVTAAAAGGTMPSNYMQAIVDRIHPTVQRLSNCFEGDELVQRSVIANAQQSATDLVSNSALLREAIARGELKVMSALYDLHSGVVTSVTPAAPPAASALAQVPGH